jgi:hypothetical protein
MRGWRREGDVEDGRDAYAEQATKQGIARQDKARQAVVDLIAKNSAQATRCDGE